MPNPKPKPGIHQDVPEDQYHAWDAVNASKLKLLARTPAHARQEVLFPPEPSPAKELGTAVHKAILEPDLFRELYVPIPKIDRRSKKGKEEWKAFEEAHKDNERLPQDDYDICLGMTESVWKHPQAREILSGKGVNELSIVWVDETTGLLCKARIDRLTMLGQWPVAVDVKSTRDASKGLFRRDVANFGYHVSAAFYLQGLEAVAPTSRRFLWIAVEKVPPYCVQIFELDEEDLRASAEEARRHLDLWAACTNAGKWPGYPNDIQILNLPEWKRREQEWEGTNGV